MMVVEKTLIPERLIGMNELYNELCRFDWWYEYSDDHSVWKRGSDKETELSNKAESLGESGRTMYSKFRYEYSRGKRELPQLSDFTEEN